jgi:hypothetical protein
MARGAAVPGDTREAVEREWREKWPQFALVRVAKLDLGDHPWVQQGAAADNWWVVVFEDPDPESAPFAQQDDPEGEAKRSIRADFDKKLRLASDS